MTARIETCPALHRVDLAPQIRNRMGRARIGRRGEQPEDAELADWIAVGVEALDADIIEISAAMDTRLHVGLHDDERLRLLEEGAKLRRHRHRLAAARKHRDVVMTENAQTRAGHRLK